MSTTAGIDIGAESIKGVVLGRSGNGAVEMLAAGTMPIGDLGHMDDSQDKILAIGVKLKELVKTARLKGTSRRVGASGKSTSIRYIQVPPVPPWRLEMLVNYEVNEKSGDKDAQTYDYHILDVPETGGQYTVMIGMLKESVAADLLSVGKNSGLGEVEIDLEAVALYNAYYHGHGFDPDKTVLVADIGADDLTILLCHNGGLFFARTVMGGGRRFTQVLADELKIDVAEAEELKKTTAEISFDLTPMTGRTARIPRPGGGVLSARGGTVMMSRTGPGATARLDPAAAPAAGASATQPSPKQDSEMLSSTLSLGDSTLSDLPEMPPSLEVLEGKTSDPQTTLIGGSLDLHPPSADQPVPQPPKPAQSQPTPTQGMPTGSGGIMDLAEDRRKRQMTGALVREAATLCAALENAVLFSKQQTKSREIKIDRLYLTGGGSKLKGLSEFMARRMRVEVMPLEPFRQVSLMRLPEEHQAALKAEQHTMAVATGLALSDLQRGAFSFLLWPEAVTQKKKFWARGAYLYYAAALIVLSLALFLFAPYRNEQALQANFEKAENAVNDAQAKNQELKKLADNDEENRNRLKQIADNTLSGHYFLNLLAELKSTARINDDVWLTQVSTNMPQVIRNLGEGGPAEKGAGLAGLGGKKAALAAAAEGGEPDTFQTQRRVYLRGFVRGDKDGAVRIEKIRDFLHRIVPYPDDPENPANLFKDVRPIWFSTDDYKQGTRKIYLQDAQFNRLKGSTQSQIWIYDKETGTAVHRMVSIGQPKDGWVEIAGPQMDQAELMITGDVAAMGNMTDGQKLRIDGEDVKAEGRDMKLKAVKLKLVENFWYLTEFVLEAYTEGTREQAPAKKPAATPRGKGVNAPAAPAAPAPEAAPVHAPAVQAPAVQEPAPAVNPFAPPTAQPAQPIAPAVPQAKVDQAAPAPAVPDLPKKKKFTMPAQAPDAAK